MSLYNQTYGPGSYTPIIPVTYWSFRLMIGIGLLSALIAIVALWLLRRSRRAGDPLHINLTGGKRRVLLWSVIALPLLPLVANSFGWIFTEASTSPAEGRTRLLITHRPVDAADVDQIVRLGGTPQQTVTTPRALVPTVPLAATV